MYKYANKSLLGVGIRIFTTLLVVLVFGMGISAQAWQQVNDVPFDDHHTNGYGYNGKGYAIQGGFNANTNILWEYTPGTDVWKNIGHFAGPERDFAIGDDWQGKYYYGFGDSDSGPLNDLWVFDPVDTSFTELPACPCTPRYHPAFVAHNDKIFMGTGSSGTGNLGDWWEYDMISMVWTQRPNVPGQTRHHPFQFAIDDYVYVGGGHRDDWNRYDPATTSWTAIDNAPAGRVAGSQFSYGGKGFLVAGDDASHDHIPDSETFMAYDPVSDAWAELPSLPRGSRWANSSMIIDDELFFFGGVDYDNGDSNLPMWKFDMSVVDCLPVENPRVTFSDTSSVDLIWSSFGQSNSDTLKWRELGATDWVSIANPQVVYTLDGLKTCQEYEFQVISVCDTQISTSEVILFRTEGCCVEPDLLVTVTTTTANVDWSAIFDATEYSVRYRALGVTGWMDTLTSNTSVIFEDLLECQEYDFQIASICPGEVLNFGPGVIKKTEGCMSSVTGVEADSRISAYPNPFNQTLSFKSELLSRDGYNLDFKNTLGKTILRVSNHSIDKDLDLSAFASGIYFLSLEKDGQIQSIKLIKY